MPVFEWYYIFSIFSALLSVYCIYYYTFEKVKTKARREHWLLYTVVIAGNLVNIACQLQNMLQNSCPSTELECKMLYSTGFVVINCVAILDLFLLNQYLILTNYVKLNHIYGLGIVATVLCTLTIFPIWFRSLIFIQNAATIFIVVMDNVIAVYIVVLVNNFNPYNQSSTSNADMRTNSTQYNVDPKLKKAVFFLFFLAVLDWVTIVFYVMQIRQLTMKMFTPGFHFSCSCLFYRYISRYTINKIQTSIAMQNGTPVSISGKQIDPEIVYEKTQKMQYP